jgi:type I restriction enzyme S subunit
MFGDLIKNTKDWKLSRFGDICESRLGKMLDSKQQTGENQRKYLRNANVQWDQFYLNNLLEMDFKEKDRDTFRLKHGDLLLCEGGEIGRAAIWRNEISECYFQKALHRVRPSNKLATAEYLLHLMWFFARNGGFKNHATSATIAHLTGVKLKEMVIPLPPIELQKKFSNYYFSAKSLQFKYSHLINDSQNLFNSISQRAFRGEL